MAEVAKNLLKLILGIMLIIVALWVAMKFSGWGQAALDLIQGGVIIVIILIGLILVMLGFSDLKG